MAKELRIIDLFSGCGGLTLGFTKVRRHGESVFGPVWANDFDRAAADTYRANLGDHCRHGDIVEIVRQERDSIPLSDVVIGGPPCQGFSLLNKGKEADPRKELWIPFMDVVELSRASMFVMENVPQLLR